ncbi:hypothetical protein AVEN_86243-1 [Araneus ventricosus]|uniref:Uncharacterized protein n=1 Tax=Araneus ventricosus TaxID=182803 RepID=A0A4Y2X8K7_ARAVE|nr:hypothetical protein AVEN_135555-1 [Araneus ventricosus]GBO45864.1 hypothetical protein AVEN_169967-1 [Araneus ventricosus]GBO45995.1 hypothetical protein AVEN_37891-1 [Araneus ventricosus]GBO45998.1 hypothetical protein AVEN_86243-1 [Araneus ventricosus]
MSRSVLAGNLNHPLNMTHHKTDAGEFHSPQHHADMSFLVLDEGRRGEVCRKMMLRDKRLGTKTGGRQAANASHRSKQGSAFFGLRPAKTTESAEEPSVVLSGLHPASPHSDLFPVTIFYAVILA